MTEQHSGHHAILCDLETGPSVWTAICTTRPIFQPRRTGHNRIFAKMNPGFSSTLSHLWSPLIRPEKRLVSSFPGKSETRREKETHTSPGVEMTASGHTFCSWDWRILYVNKGGRMKLTYEEKLETVQVEGPHASCSWVPSWVLRVLWGRRPSILTTITLSSFSEPKWLSSFAIKQVLIHHVCMGTMKTWWHAVSLFKRHQMSSYVTWFTKQESGRLLHEYLYCDRSSRKFKFTSKIKRESETQIRLKHM